MVTVAQAFNPEKTVSSPAGASLPIASQACRSWGMTSSLTPSNTAYQHT